MTAPALSSSTIDAIDRVFEGFEATTPGCQVAVAVGGQLLFSRGYGMADLEQDREITPQTIFHVASTSKQFAAFAIAMLAERGQLDLDADIRTILDWFPELRPPGSDDVHPVTTRQLVHHISGVRDQWELLMLSGFRMDDVITTANIVEVLRGQRELNFVPGTQHLYSNAGYTLMALIVEAVDGRNLRTFCDQELFTPLKMASTHFHDDHTELVPARAHSYLPRAEGGWRLAPLAYANVGATSLFTTAEDLVRWMADLDAGTVAGDAVRDLVHRRGVLADGTSITYAFGLMHGERGGRAVVEHGGGDAGFRSQALRVLGEDAAETVSVVVLSNAGNASPDALVHAVLDALAAQEPGLLFASLATPAGKPAPASDPTDGPEPTETTDGEQAPGIGGFAGLYRDHAAGGVYGFEVSEDGDLMVTVPMRAALTRVGPTTFTYGAGVIVVEFPEGPGGPLSIQVGPSTPRVAEPATAAEPTPAQLDEMVGQFRSAELDVTWRIEREGDVLSLVRRKIGGRPMTPLDVDGWLVTGRDLFADGVPLNIAVTRGSDGSVDGLRVSGGRVLQVQFNRVIPG